MTPTNDRAHDWALLEADVWARFACASSAYELPDVATDADAMLEEWRKRFRREGDER